MTHLPELDFEPRPDVTLDDLLDVLTRHSNRLIFGRDERGGENEPGELTAFRAVIIVGGMLGMNPQGELAPFAVGVLNADGSANALTVYPKMAKRLRTIADEIEQMALEKQRSSS